MARGEGSGWHHESRRHSEAARKSRPTHAPGSGASVPGGTFETGRFGIKIFHLGGDKFRIADRAGAQYVIVAPDIIAAKTLGERQAMKDKMAQEYGCEPLEDDIRDALIRAKGRGYCMTALSKDIALFNSFYDDKITPPLIDSQVEEVMRKHHLSRSEAEKYVKDRAAGRYGP